MRKTALALASLWALSGGTAYPAEDEPSVLFLPAAMPQPGAAGLSGGGAPARGESR